VTCNSALAKTMMKERDWELYRLSVVERQPESTHKDSVIAGIKHKLKLLDHARALNDTKVRSGNRLRMRRSRTITPTL
jgi:hypothetical protein